MKIENERLGIDEIFPVDKRLKKNKSFMSQRVNLDRSVNYDIKD